ncbi:unnamed protein product [Rhizophagus irregularis]|nr:unnamed protein product [Rhizophagus irregularis]
MELSLARSFALSCDPERGEIDDERANINDLEYVEQNTGKENLDRVAEQYIINDDECENESVKEYTVEKEGKLQFLLKWKGWSPEYNTWENYENVIFKRFNCEYTVSHRLNNAFSDLKDLYSGTSAGGFIAAGLSVPSWKILYELSLLSLQ